MSPGHDGREKKNQRRDDSRGLHGLGECLLSPAVEGGLRDRLHALTADTPLEILRLKNERIRERVLTQNTDSETLDDLNPLDVFERCLAAHHIPADQRDALRQNYREILAGLDDDRPQ